MERFFLKYFIRNDLLIYREDFNSKKIIKDKGSPLKGEANARKRDI